MDLAERITQVLTPHLGGHTADSVARHLCAKHALLGEGPVDPEKARELRDTIRRGLVAFVGPDQAEQIARSCFENLP
jgi:hypothetical protein